MKNSKARIIIIIAVIILVLTAAGVLYWQYFMKENLNNAGENSTLTEDQTQTTETKTTDTKETTDTKSTTENKTTTNTKTSTTTTGTTATTLSASTIESIDLHRANGWIDQEFKAQIDEFTEGIRNKEYSEEQIQEKAGYFQNYIDYGFSVHVNFEDKATINKYVNLLNNKKEVTGPAGLGILEYEMTIYYSNGTSQTINLDLDTDGVYIREVAAENENGSLLSGKLYTCKGIKDLFHKTVGFGLIWWAN